MERRKETNRTNYLVVRVFGFGDRGYTRVFICAPPALIHVYSTYAVIPLVRLAHTAHDGTHK